jgi:dihydroorotase
MAGPFGTGFFFSIMAWYSPPESVGLFVLRRVVMTNTHPLDQPSINEIELEGSVDPHFHFREDADAKDGRLEMLLEEIVDEHEIAVGIGNTSKPIKTLADARVCQSRIRSHLRSGSSLDVRIAPLITDNTTPEMIREMRADPDRTVAFAKVFFAGVSNDGGASVSHIDNIDAVMRATYDESVDAPPLPVDFHAERKFGEDGLRLPMSEREWYCVNTDLRTLFYRHQNGNFAIKHVSDLRTLDFIHEQRTLGRNIWGEICPTYLLDALEDLFEGLDNKGTVFRASKVRWPFPKSDPSKYALGQALLSGAPYFFYGSDCACHIEDPTQESGVKITCDGFVCGGVTILPAVDKSIVIDFFVENGKPELINEYMSRRARARLRLPASTRTNRYVRNDWVVPTFLEGVRGDKAIRARRYMYGETCHWIRAS